MLSLRNITITKFICLRIIRWFPSDNLTHFVRSSNLITSKLISNLCKIINRNQLERITEEHNRLTLGTSSLTQELTLTLICDRSNDRLNCSVIVIQHRLIVGSSIHDSLSDTELTVQLRSQILNLFHQVILNWTIQLNNFFGSVGICDTVWTFKLFFYIFTAHFGLLTSCI